MSNRVEIDEAIRMAAAEEDHAINGLWAAPLSADLGPYQERAYRASAKLAALRAAKARGETHVDEE